MEISTSSLASLGYSQARTAVSPSAEGGSATISGFVQDFTDTLRNGEETAKSAMLGGVEPHALVQALAQTELAVETAVAIRDKVVEAYQEILRMPV
ncbi:flagellar hook-basal body complex protein FliE [Paenirhodobacter populi]|uniref:Flagellar hook-basal body complex protein FliE n=1 Tax=Paenirhodobacter populi TaxID=2306993 RepID=A0A443JSR4_9RHOB|nr:flagellar hook-basal body complex protein FliE [Sinirhodobacter populi]RWR12297.1 flagellar hook-basal body complex protein FliE [Sinirhodobacter populi]RWR23537.1 flagellar hook-basal body complex protein FliE [Sinirhodobacter populi]RWR28231.1 flagellar hook-basal body complex protein FliE [Sinirhodobacter populi]RWR30854.1 flagellar hook-basal body complex protein FliE [Sinirhodobacter populi]